MSLEQFLQLFGDITIGKTVTYLLAIISDGIIRNVSVGEYEITNYIAKASFGQDAFAVEVTQYPVQEGDLYKEGRFYRVNPKTKEETEILPLPTEKDEINRLSADSTDLQQSTAQNTANIEYIAMMSNVDLGV